MTLSPDRCAIAERLIDLEASLRQLGMWSESPPPEEALASQQPFAVDTLAFSEWLQFVFLPRIYATLEAGSALPESCAVAPMAEESFRGQQRETGSLIDVLRELDELISATP